MESNKQKKNNPELEQFIDKKYQYGFITDIESETLPPGLDENVIRLISEKKNEPEFLLKWRLKAFKHWQKLKPPMWGHLEIDDINYQAISYFSKPKQENIPKSLEDVDPKLLDTYEKLGIPLHERAALAGVAVDAVFDSVSVTTTFKEKLAEAGVIFCPFSEAVRQYPDLIKKYLGKGVPYRDNV
jgi:Fe-S cluster assembly protein SufB